MTVGADMPFASLTLIDKGWSGDRKYRAVYPDGTAVLYRVTPPGSYKQKKSEFEYMRRAATLGVPMCRPLAFGVNADGVYSIQSWIDGENAETAVPLLPARRQFLLGEESGRILRTLHTIPVPPYAAAWEARFNRKIDRKIAMYEACPLRYPRDRLLYAVIAENRALLHGRPQVMQHGDYHIGNMMLRDGHIAVIDFNRFDWGDPYEEFNRIVWCAQASPAFAAGQVRGYFGGEPPLLFWRLLALYIASNTLSSLPWAIPFGQGEIDTMLRQAEEVLTWYHGMETVVPTWYEEGCREYL